MARAALKNHSIKSLYRLALAEGEGVGTAYEYYAKRLALRRWPALKKPISSILIAGLPERYGSSLDFLLLAAELGATTTVIDDRAEALARLRTSLERLWGSRDGIQLVEPAAWIIGDLPTLASVSGAYDLVLSSEVLQRLTPDARAMYVRRLSRMAAATAMFAPNADNPGHTALSGLSGVSLEEMRRLAHGVSLTSVADYIDMPPFPPGMTRTDAQRRQAGRGRKEALAMRGLGGYARLERFVPSRVRRSRAHIVYSLWAAG